MTREAGDEVATIPVVLHCRAYRKAIRQSGLRLLIAKARLALFDQVQFRESLERLNALSARVGPAADSRLGAGPCTVALASECHMLGDGSILGPWCQLGWPLGANLGTP